jgi:hypothetical protein
MHKALQKVWLFGVKSRTLLPNKYAGFKSKQPASKPAGDKKKQADLAGSMNNLSVAEKVTVKSKNLDVLAEYQRSKRKNAMNFAVIGLFLVHTLSIICR